MKKNREIYQLKKEGKVTTANEIPIPKNYVKCAVFFKDGGLELRPLERNEAIKGYLAGEMVSIDTATLDLISNFCNLESITAAELIEGYKLSKKKFKGTGEPKQGNKPVIQDFTKENAVGKPYNPFSNPLFASKIDKASKK